MSATPLLDKGIKLFNAGNYFEAHEVWEDLWRQTEDPLRKFYQGLIQAAVGLYHLQRGNTIGARGQLTKSLRKLEEYPPKYCGINNSGLVTNLQQAVDRSEFAGVQIRIEVCEGQG